jgi:hypothetical protein
MEEGILLEVFLASLSYAKTEAAGGKKVCKPPTVNMLF